MCQTNKSSRIFCIQGLLFLVVYLAGGVTGAVIWQAVGQPDRPFKHFRDNPDRFEENLARRIVGRYALPPQSEEKLIEIIHANNVKMQGLHKEFSPQFEACLREMQTKIRELIPADRREEYDQEVKELRGRMAAFQPPRDRMRPGKPQSAEPGARDPEANGDRPQRPGAARPGEPRDPREPDMGMEMKKDGWRHHRAEGDRRERKLDMQGSPLPPERPGAPAPQPAEEKTDTPQPPAPAPAAPAPLAPDVNKVAPITPAPASPTAQPAL